ncbi:MAG: HpcH/HpaI aldolase/citrate lyase family protein [Aestuariivirga sp.]
MTYRPRRSVLYMPGNNDRALEKAKSLDVDALILDLEDSVAPEQKGEAREKLKTVVSQRGFGRREVAIRVNALDTAWAEDDLRMAAAAKPDAVLIPKVNNPGDVMTALAKLHAAGAPRAVNLWAMIETPHAILNLREISAEAPAAQLTCFILGTNDLVKETRASITGGRFAILPWLSMAVIAGRAAGIDVIDGVYNDFKDEVGFRAECEQGRALGMDGKTLIHPSQIASCNDMFSPSEAEVTWASKVIAAFALPENIAKGVLTVEDKMVERLHLTMAERVAAIAKTIRA